MIYKLKSFYNYHIKGQRQYQKALKALSSDATPVVVYTMAKVGSLSVYSSIQKQTSFPTFHVHTLKKEKIQLEYEICRAKGWWPDSKNTGGLIYTKKVLPKKPLKIITAVREPIGRNLSAFFEVFRYYNGVSPTQYHGNQEELKQTFLKELPHDYPLVWLEEELASCIGIDVYQHSFDTTKKYQLYQNENIEMLLFRVDLPDSEKEDCIRRFLDIPSFQLVNQNIGSQKDYAALYQEFKKNIKLPKDYLQKMLGSKYAKHFYTNEERKSLLEQWEQN
ncbi:MAG: hypothetical protein GY810_24295 [Aureispira sp.]|nr:hypothetical protein [Aureispira sp.]